MKRLVPLLLGVFSVVLATSALACEKHLGGHQTSSNTASEAVRQ